MRKLLKIFFHYFYHELAWTYDLVAALVSVGRWGHWRKAILAHTRGPRVLEIGFGTGHLQVELSRSSFVSFGLDESRQMAQIALANMARNRLSPALSCGLAQALPFAAHSFDGAVITFPSEYIFDVRSLAELQRVMKPSGRLVVVPMAWITGKTVLDRAAKWLFRFTGQTENIAENLEDKFRLFFQQAGFQVTIVNELVENSIVMVIIAEISSDTLET